MSFIGNKSTTSPESSHRHLRRQLSWPLSASDAKERTRLGIEDLTDTIFDLKWAVESTKRITSGDLRSRLNPNVKAEKEHCFNNMSFKQITSYVHDLILSPGADKMLKNIAFQLEERRAQTNEHVRQYFSKYENAETSTHVSLRNIKEMKTKTTGKSNVLDFLFFLHWVPEQIYNIMPLSLGSYFESLTSGSTVGVTESMSNNFLRLSSFSNFPRRINIFSIHFTNAGFYFTGQSDTVKCYACGVSHSNWNSADDPLEIHRRLNPNCPHLLNLNSQNNSVRATAPSVEVHSASGYTSEQNSKDRLKNSYHERINNTKEASTSPNKSVAKVSEEIGTCNTQNRQSTVNGITRFHNETENTSSLTSTSTNVNGETRIQDGLGAIYSQRANVRTENASSNSSLIPGNSRSSQSNGSSEVSRTPSINENNLTMVNKFIGASNIDLPVEDLPSLGINLEKPKYPNYAPIQVRISSYQNWPGYLDQTPKMMATAGFLYAGYNDYTRCFFCGGGLRNWEAGDDPWVEHARWFPKCTYLLQNKGSKFIRAVQEKHQEVMAEQNNLENTGTNLSTQNLNQPNQTQPMTNSQSSHHNSQNPLGTVAAKSVLEMGYSDDQVVQAIEKLRTLKRDTAISATEIMTVLLEENLEGSSASIRSSNNATPEPALAGTSAIQSSSNKDTLQSTNATKREIRSKDNQKGASMEFLSSQGASGDTSTNKELASVLDDTEQLLEENRQLRDQRLCKKPVGESVPQILIAVLLPESNFYQILEERQWGDEFFGTCTCILFYQIVYISFRKYHMAAISCFDSFFSNATKLSLFGQSGNIIAIR